MANRNGTTAAEAIQAIHDAEGFVTYAAKRLGISRVQLHRIINKHPTVKEALIDAREATKDLAESELLKNIKAGKEASIFFYLKTQAQDRHYIEKQQVEHSGSVENKLVVLPSKDE
jgi:hypothetical protein